MGACVGPDPAMQTGELLDYLFDGRGHALYQPMAEWLASSRQFSAFATTFRDKIRKKLRTVQDQSGLLDLQLELETAYLLLQERALSVAYESEHSKRVRSPDFAVTFTTSLTFMVEVTRVQGGNKAGGIGKGSHTPPSESAPADSPLGSRLAEVVVSKLGQLLPQRSNILLVAVEGARVTTSDVRAAMLGLQRRAERDDPIVFGGRGVRDRAEFFRHYQRLSEVLVRTLGADPGNALVTWINPQAKQPLPAKVRTVLYRSLAR